MAWHRKFYAGTFPTDDAPFKSFVLFVRVNKNGDANVDAMVRMPYSNRPKRGGCRAVPYHAMNPVGVVHG